MITTVRACWLGGTISLGFIAVLMLAGCNDDRRTPALATAPAAFTPNQFSDIPLPRGYVFSPGEDQLAVTVAGGTVRRFEVAMEQRESAKSQSPTELLNEMERDLTMNGWVSAPGHSDKLQWHKGQERLVLETGRTDGRTTIRLRLRPANLAGP